MNSHLASQRTKLSQRKHQEAKSYRSQHSTQKYQTNPNAQKCLAEIDLASKEDPDEPIDYDEQQTNNQFEHSSNAKGRLIEDKGAMRLEELEDHGSDRFGGSSKQSSNRKQMYR